MFIAKKIRIIMLALAASVTIQPVAKTGSSVEKILFIAAGSALGFLGGHYWTEKAIKQSQHDNESSSSKFNKVTPFIGGFAGTIIGGAFANFYYNAFFAVKKYPFTPSTTSDDAFDNSDNASGVHAKVNKANVEQVKITDIVGLDSVIKDIKEVIEQIKHPEIYKKFDVKLPKGILLEGPPGTGKTMIAKALAHETGCSFFYAAASSFDTEWVGSGAKNIRKLFDSARKAKPAIICIDEIDAIGSRTKKIGHDNSQTIAQILTEMDGFLASDGILVIAATNHKSNLDEALLRAGRFDRIIKVPLPNYESRYALAKHLQKTKPHIEASDAWLKKLAQQTEGLGAADIKNIFNLAGQQAAREKAAAVKEIYLEAALQKILSERKK